MTESDINWPPWEELAAHAERVVAGVQRRLPPELRARAETVPVTLLDVPDETLQEDGLAPDLLGLFVGDDARLGGDSPAPLPAQILLFLDNLWDFAEGDWETFRTEVRTTYLHELGHFLGLDEDAIELRGLA